MKTDEDVRRVEETKTDLELTSQKSKFMIKSMSKTKKNEPDEADILDKSLETDASETYETTMDKNAPQSVNPDENLRGSASNHPSADTWKEETPTMLLET